MYHRVLSQRKEERKKASTHTFNVDYAQIMTEIYSNKEIDENKKY